MDTRKVSALVGFAILIGCVVAVVVVIYNGSTRTSYRTSIEESWKKRSQQKTMPGRHDVLGSSLPTTSESSVQEAKKLADELQKLFKGSKGVVPLNKWMGGNVPQVEIKEDEKESKLRPRTLNPLNTTGSTLPRINNKTWSSTLNKPTSTSPLPLPQDSLSSNNHSNNHHQHHESGRVGERPMEKEQPTPVLESAKEDLAEDTDDHHYPTSDIPSISSRPPQKRLSPNHGTTTTSSILNPYHLHEHRSSNILLVKSSSAPSMMSHQRNPSHQHHHHHSHSPSQIHTQFRQQKDKLPDEDEGDWSNEQEEGLEESEELNLPIDIGDQEYYQPQMHPHHLLDNSKNKDPLKAMGNMLQLVSDVYKRGKDGLDVAGFLKVINETVQRGNNNNLLSQLNKIYSRSGNWSTNQHLEQRESVVGRNSLENSISGFLFMSFGVFLLNQIHKFMGIGKSEIRQGRTLDFALDDSELNFLFEPPSTSKETSTKPPSSTTATTDVRQETFSKSSVKDGFSAIADVATTIMTPFTNNDSLIIKSDEQFEGKINPAVEKLPKLDLNGTGGDSSNTSNYVNNMFRAAINLVNAYTKDTKALDCIWWKYCRDLDKTAAKQGFYSIAARINSVGLRLIMGQIPTELTVDVVLRSLLGWDGLPCIKMFSKCNLVHGQLLRDEDENKGHNQTLVPS